MKLNSRKNNKKQINKFIRYIKKNKYQIIIFFIGLIIIFYISQYIAKIIISDEIEINKKYFESEMINIYEIEFPGELNVTGGTAYGKFNINFIWGGDQLFRILINTSGFIHEQKEDKINVKDFSISFFNDSRKYIQMKPSGWTILGDKLDPDFNLNIIYFKVDYPANLYTGNYNATFNVKMEPIIDEETYMEEQLQKFGNWGQWYFTFFAILLWCITFMKSKSCKHKNLIDIKFKNGTIVVKCSDCDEIIKTISTKWKF